MNLHDAFQSVSKVISKYAGSVWAFLGGAAVVIIWAAFGPAFEWSNSHSLFINTFTTICTFLMVFVIQNTQNRDGKAMQLKLDELIRAQKKSRNDFINIEDMSDKELKALQAEMKKVSKNGDVSARSSKP